MNCKDVILNVSGFILGMILMIPIGFIGLFMMYSMIIQGFIPQFWMLVVIEILLLAMFYGVCMIMPWYRNKIQKAKLDGKSRGEQWATKVLPVLDTTVNRMNDSLDRMNDSLDRITRTRLKKLEEMQVYLDNTTGMDKLWVRLKMNIPFFLQWHIDRARKDLKKSEQKR